MAYRLTIWAAGFLLALSSALATATPSTDLNGDGKSDLLWYNAATGQTSIWLMNGGAATAQSLILTDPNWRISNTGDFNGDGKADLLWYNATTGQTAIWLMNGTGSIAQALILTDPQLEGHTRRGFQWRWQSGSSLVQRIDWTNVDLVDEWDDADRAGLAVDGRPLVRHWHAGSQWRWQSGLTLVQLHDRTDCDMVDGWGELYFPSSFADRSELASHGHG